MTEQSANLGETEAPRKAADLTDYINDATAVLPPLLDMGTVVAQIVSLFQSVDGATFNLYFGSMVVKPYIAVSIYQDPEARHSKWWNGKSPSLFKLRAFIAANRELLGDPRNSVGVWYNPKENRTYLEVTATVPFRDKADYTEAIRQGRRYNQISIYDLEEKAYIEIGGTGQLPADTPPVSERLPHLQRGMEL